MGCTSSAPSMVAANPNVTNKISEHSEEETEQSINEDDDIIMSAEEENGNNEIKVLPSCDTLGDPMQLDSNNKSIDTSDLGLEKESPTYDDNVTENSNKDTAKEADKEETSLCSKEDKLSSLEDVVEKVVELYVTENLLNNIQYVPDQDDQIDNSVETKPTEPELPEQSAEVVDQPNESEEIPEEAISPSQSTSSRATRWEALADVAAELPPSLTIDPVTGHIYALSK